MIIGSTTRVHFGRLIVVILVALLIRTGYKKYGHRIAGTIQVNSMSNEETKLRALAKNSSILSKFNLYKDGSDAGLKGNFTVQNNGDVDVKDIVIKCLHSDAGGKVIGFNIRTIYEVVPAHKNQSFENVSMGSMNSQTHSSDCRIEGLSLAQ